MARSNGLLRALDPAEAFFSVIDTVSSMNCVVWAERTVPLELGAQRRALEWVQARHALLQARLVWDERTGLFFAAAAGQPVPRDVRDACAST
ncbi:MAG: hypothetical protein OHK0048_06490 [Rhodoferax sp.]